MRNAPRTTDWYSNGVGILRQQFTRKGISNPGNASLQTKTVTCPTPIRGVLAKGKESELDIKEYIRKKVAKLAREHGYYREEEVFDLTMEAKKTGWDDCVVWHKSEGYVKL